MSTQRSAPAVFEGMRQPYTYSIKNTNAQKETQPQPQSVVVGLSSEKTSMVAFPFAQLHLAVRTEMLGQTAAV